MQSTQNTDYFENQLITLSSALNSPLVDQLISDMVIYARHLEKEKKKEEIPPGDSLPARPRPEEEIKSAQFSTEISNLPTSTPSALLAIFESFLEYIINLENTVFST